MGAKFYLVEISKDRVKGVSLSAKDRALTLHRFASVESILDLPELFTHLGLNPDSVFTRYGVMPKPVVLLLYSGVTGVTFRGFFLFSQNPPHTPPP